MHVVCWLDIKDFGHCRQSCQGTFTQPPTAKDALAGAGLVGRRKGGRKKGSYTNCPSHGDPCVVEVYSGTSLLRTPSGPHEVSQLKRCTYFRGCLIHLFMWLGQQAVS